MLKSLLPIFTLIFFAACSSTTLPKNEEGISYTYLLNTQEYLRTQLQAFGKLNGKFIQVTPQGKLMDTAYLNGVDVDWNYYIQPFLDVNMHQLKYDSVYSMSQVLNEANAQVDIQYKALFDNLPLTSMQILLNAQTNDIQMIYAEAKHNKPWNKRQEYLLYKPGQIIQVKSKQSKWLGSNQDIVRTLYFPENTYTTTTATIN